MTSTHVHEAIDTLGHAFEEFKKTNDQRLTEITTKGAADTLTEEKASRLNSAVEKASKTLDSLKAMSMRPASGGEKADTVSYQAKEAFEGYIRKGQHPRDMELKELSSTSGESGGYLIPQNLSSRIQASLKEFSPIRQLASTCQISTDSLDILSEKGEASVGWVGETAKRDTTKTPEFIKHRIAVHEIFAKPKASQKLLDDASVNLEEWLSQKIAEQMAAFENKAFVEGNGEGKPKGFLAYPGADVGKGEWGKLEQVFTGHKGEIKHADCLFDLFHSLKPQYLPGAVWVMSRSAQSAIRKLKDESTGSYLWQPGLAQGSVNTLLGHPVVTVDDMPALTKGTSTQSVSFANFRRGYQVVDRKSITILRDPYSEKPYVEFYATKRVGGDVIDFDAIKVLTFDKRS